MESYIMAPGAHTAVWSRNSVGRAATLSAHAPMKTSNTDLLIATAPDCLFPFEDGQSLVAPAHAVCRATNTTPMCTVAETVTKPLRSDQLPLSGNHSSSVNRSDMKAKWQISI